MRRYRHIALTLLTAAVLGYSCKDPYVSPYISPATGYLVVEGYISGNTTTTFSLTRTIGLPGDSTLPTVDGATVQVEASDNSVYPLTGQGGGIYSSKDTLPLNSRLQYRLRIKTGSGEYLSAYVPYKPTPLIDSINWVQNGDYSIQIYANTHDPADNTHYYQWSYSYVYEYRSADYSNDYYDKDTVPPAVVPRPPADQVYRCWMSGNSSNIIIGSSVKLASDVIYRQPVNLLPADDISTSVLYSILVKQTTLTEDGYNFFTQMQKNTESLGSIFDAQPTQLSSNIQNIANPAETVIGFVSAGTVQQQRIFISRYQIVNRYTFACPEPDTVIPPDQHDINLAFGGNLFTPLVFVMGPPATGWESNYSECINCTLRGGSNIMPSFWPN